MDFIENLQALSTKIQKQRDAIQTEEATKNAFILPFINALGYDIFDPTEVVPEYTADVGIKKGEKVDYAILRDGKVIMLFECKSCNNTLDSNHASQLYRYFSVTAVRIAVLTDGITYRFYTDIEEPNKMDAKPFMELNMLDIQEPLVAELKRLTKQAFNIDEIITIAGEMKYTREIKRVLSEQLVAPYDEFVRFLASHVYQGKLTQSVREQFKDITKRAFSQFINERINDRLRSAMAEASGASQSTGQVQKLTADVTPEPVSTDSRIETTEDEMQAFYIIRAILYANVDPARVVHRDTQSYFGILLDDTNRKPLCRLHFNTKQKKIGLFNMDKQEEIVPIENLNDIYKLSDRLKATLLLYEPK